MPTILGTFHPKDWHEDFFLYIPNIYKVVDNIKNRAGDNLCPMEKKVQSINNPEEAYKMFKEMFENFTPASFQ